MNRRVHRRVLAECLRFLEINGVKATPAVTRVIEHFFSTDAHVTIDEIERFARTEGISARRADIQRAVSLLVNYGFAFEKDFGDGPLRYEHVHLDEHHDHLCCVKCGKIEEFVSPAIEEEQLAAAREHGFHVFTHKMQIHGLCDRCFGESADTLAPLSTVAPGGRFRIVDIGDDRPRWGIRRRLGDLGLVAGTEGRVIQNGHGLVVVVVGGARIALGRRQCEKVQTMLLN